MTYAVRDTPEVQAFGFYLLNCDTNDAGGAEAAMTALDVRLASVIPTFDATWDISDCGSSEGVNYCQLGVDEDSSLGTISCDSDPSNDCIASIDLYDGSNELMTTAEMETALNAMSFGGSQFMVDGDGVGVNVTRTREIVDDLQDDSVGVYHVEYRVTFAGRHNRGNVPTIALTTSSALATYSSTYGGYEADDGTLFGYLSTCCDATCSANCPQQLGAVYLDDQYAYEVLEGNQPDGSIKLEYECEARTTRLDSVAATSGSTTALLAGLKQEVLRGDWVRVSAGGSDAYYEVARVHNQGADDANVTLATAYVGATSVLTDAEVGIFYSDPTVEDGVSSACATSRVRSTDVINVDASSATFSSSLRSVATVESSSAYLVVSQPRALPGNSSYVGLYVDIEFLAQPGDGKPMVCDTSYLAASSDATGSYCNVTTLQDGSLADGDFTLTTYWPNERVAGPRPYNATGLRWNAPAATMDARMETVGADDGVSLAFGLVDVARSAYTPSTDARWSGAYAWSVTFLSATGNVPALRAGNNVSVSYESTERSLDPANWGASAVDLEVEDEASGPSDTFQGAANSYQFGLDSDGAARDGGQVSGSYGLTFGEAASSGTAMSITNATTHRAISADEFKDQFEAALFSGRDVVDVARSASPNRAAGYAYTITYRSAEVGGDVALLGTNQDSLLGTGAAVNVDVMGEGAQIYGSFQLRFNGYTTGILAFDSSAEDLEAQLNALQSISPSKVAVSRSGPLTLGPDLSGGVQVGGYAWSITFASDVWRDPTLEHPDTADFYGNWVGAPAAWADTWSTGVSMEWGKNTGDMPSISCVDAGLYSSNGALPSDACSVSEYLKGTEPVGGTFAVELDTTGHPVINEQGAFTSGPIRHNAFATIAESGGDGSSVEEVLEAMPNVGDVQISRSAVNEGGNNGGHTWTITFLRDAGASGAGQFGDCEQRDTVDNLCNSPGDVPKFSGFDASSLTGDCSDANGYDCQKVTLLAVEDGGGAPPATTEVQIFKVSDPEFVGFGVNETSSFKRWKDGEFAKSSYRIAFNGEFYDACLPYDAEAAEVRDALFRIGRASSYGPTRDALKNVSVTRHASVTEAPNAYLYRVSFVGAGDVAAPESSRGLSFNYTAKGPASDGFMEGGCNPFNSVYQNITAYTAQGGKINPNNCSYSGCLDGVVQRGNLTTFEADGDPLGAAALAWNAPAEGAYSVKNWLDASPWQRRVVNVTREVYGRHGVVQWAVTFVFNGAEVPPGAGDVGRLNVTQASATDAIVYEPTVWETVKGSEGLSGSFEIDFEAPFGSRRVAHNETAARFQHKLEEMLTVGRVHVERHPYPSATSGGWGDGQSDGVRGGLEWRVHFLKNPGSYNGYTYPPGAGNLDSITYDAGNLAGRSPAVVNEVLRTGSTPFSGTFAVAFAGARSEQMEWQEAADEVEYVMEQLPTVGELRVDRYDVALQRVDGVTATVGRDGAVAALAYDPSFGSYGARESSLADYLAPGEVFRLGGIAGGFDAAAPGASDGSVELPSLLGYAEDAPVVDTPQARLAAMVQPGRSIRVGGDTHVVARTGMEIQRLYLAADAVPPNASEHALFRLSATHSGSTQHTACLDFGATAAAVEAELNAFDAFYDSVAVTRSGTGAHGDAFLYSIYFGAGDATAARGDVAQIAVDSRLCAVPASKKKKTR